MSPLTSPANLMSFGRAVLAPVILLLLLNGTRGAVTIALVIALGAALSDVIDGYLARRRGASTDFGRYVDGACDAIFNLAVFLGFLANHWLAPSVFALLYFSEIIVSYLGVFAKQIGTPFEVRWSARVKTAVHPLAQICVLALVLTLPDPAAGRQALGVALAMAAAVAVSLLYLADHATLAVRRTLRVA